MPDPAYVVRFAKVPPDFESVLSKAIQSVDPTLIARRGQVADDYVKEAMAPTRFTLALLGAFAVVTLVLAAVGLYGSIAYTVSQSTREIGIRVALGATPRAVMSLGIRDGFGRFGVGLVIGVATAMVSTRGACRGAGGVLCTGKASDADRSGGGVADRVTTAACTAASGPLPSLDAAPSAHHRTNSISVHAERGQSVGLPRKPRPFRELSQDSA